MVLFGQCHLLLPDGLTGCMASILRRPSNHERRSAHHTPAALIGDPGARKHAGGADDRLALTACEQVGGAGVTAQTASSHLTPLQMGGLVTATRQGRHRYYRLAGSDVAATMKALMGLADRIGHLRTRPGPSHPGLRQARVCYNHLAGDLGVQLSDSMMARALIRPDGDGITPTPLGAAFSTIFGIDLVPLTRAHRPLCKACLNWSERRNHLAGTLGQSRLQTLIHRGGAARSATCRAIVFSRTGLTAFHKSFPASQPAG